MKLVLWTDPDYPDNPPKLLLSDSNGNLKFTTETIKPTDICCCSGECNCNNCGGDLCLVYQYPYVESAYNCDYEDGCRQGHINLPEVDFFECTNPCKEPFENGTTCECEEPEEYILYKSIRGKPEFRIGCIHDKTLKNPADLPDDLYCPDRDDPVFFADECFLHPCGRHYLIGCRFDICEDDSGMKLGRLMSHGFPCLDFPGKIIAYNPGESGDSCCDYSVENLEDAEAVVTYTFGEYALDLCTRLTYWKYEDDKWVGAAAQEFEGTDESGKRKCNMGCWSNSIFYSVEGNTGCGSSECCKDGRCCVSLRATWGSPPEPVPPSNGLFPLVLSEFTFENGVLTADYGKTCSRSATYRPDDPDPQPDVDPPIPPYDGIDRPFCDILLWGSGGRDVYGLINSVLNKIRSDSQAKGYPAPTFNVERDTKKAQCIGDENISCDPELSGNNTGGCRLRGECIGPNGIINGPTTPEQCWQAGGIEFRAPIV